MKNEKALRVLLRETLNGDVDWSRHRNRESEYFTTNVCGRTVGVYPSGVLKLIGGRQSKYEANSYTGMMPRKIYRAADGSGKPGFVDNLNDFVN